MAQKKKASEDAFCDLHSMVTNELANRIRSGEASTADIRAAIEWLKTNDITGTDNEGSPLDKLVNLMPKVDPELVQRRLYGTKVSS
jgi:hypothetical protein